MAILCPPFPHSGHPVLLPGNKLTGVQGVHCITLAGVFTTQILFIFLLVAVFFVFAFTKSEYSIHFLTGLCVLKKGSFHLISLKVTLSTFNSFRCFI